MKLFKFRFLFIVKSMKQVVFELLSSEIKLSYKFKPILVFIWNEKA